MNDVEFSWENSTQPLFRVSQFQVTPGQRLFVSGGSGAGKSTFLSLIAGILIPTRGSISILGKATNKLTFAERDHLRAHHMGYIFQMFNLIPYLSVLENVLLGLRFSSIKQARLGHNNLEQEAEAKRLLNALGLNSNLANVAARNLSVGQQQRVAAARALLGDPELLLADEPTSALDAVNCAQFLELLFTECQRANIALIYVSHDQTSAANFDRQITMESFHS